MTGRPEDDTEVRDWAGAERPRRLLLKGAHVTLAPLGPTERDDLFRALNGPDRNHIWDFIPYGPFDERGWTGFVGAIAGQDDPLFFAVVRGGRAAGKLGLMAIEPYAGSIEIGGVVFSPELQRTTAATEAVFLLLEHAFALGYRRVEWRCNARNERSRRAADRFGFSYEGTFRQHMVVKGRSRDTAWFSMLDREWPGRRAAFEAWLSPDNFEPDGAQRASLACPRGA
jgi:RimJ/RimL family protein N-acetyltransferase